MSLSERLQRIEVIGLYVLCAVMPMQWIDQTIWELINDILWLFGSSPTEISRFHLEKFSLVDVLVWALAALFLTRHVMAGTLRQVHLPPVPVWVFLAWTAVSALASYGRVEPGLGAFAKTQGKELFQLVEYLFVGYLLFRNNASDRDLIRRLVLIAGTVTLCIALFALCQTVWQTVQGDTDPIWIRIGGMYDERNRYAALLALMAPVGVGIACKSHRIPIQILASLPAALALATITSGGVYIALLAGVLVTGAILGRRRLVFVALVTFGVMAVVFGVALKKQGPALYDSVRIFVKNPVDDEAVVALRYRRWNAAAGMIAERPIVGVGPGLYQDLLNQYYGEGIMSKGEPGLTDVIENYNVLADEPGSHSLYFVTAAQLGLPGLWAVLWIFIYFLGQAVRSGPRDGDGEGGPAHEDLSAGFSGSMIALLLMGLFTLPFVRGLGLVCMLLFAAAEGLGFRRGTGADVEAAPLAPGGSSAVLPAPDFKKS